MLQCLLKTLHFSSEQNRQSNRHTYVYVLLENRIIVFRRMTVLVICLNLLSAVFVFGGRLESVDAAEYDYRDQEYHPKSEHDPLLAAAAKAQQHFLESAVAAVGQVVAAAAVVVFVDVRRRAAAAVVDAVAAPAGAAALEQLHVPFLRVSSHHVCAVT